MAILYCQTGPLDKLSALSTYKYPFLFIAETKVEVAPGNIIGDVPKSESATLADAGSCQEPLYKSVFASKAIIAWEYVWFPFIVPVVI